MASLNEATTLVFFDTGSIRENIRFKFRFSQIPHTAWFCLAIDYRSYYKKFLFARSRVGYFVHCVLGD